MAEENASPNGPRQGLGHQITGPRGSPSLVPAGWRHGDRSDPSAYFFLDVGWLCAQVQYTVQCSHCVCLSRPPGACPALDSVGQVTPHAAFLLQMHGVTVQRCSRDGGTDAGGCRGSQAPSSATDRFSRVVWVRYVRARPQDHGTTYSYHCLLLRLVTAHDTTTTITGLIPSCTLQPLRR